jgi:hypothetical protein
MSRTSGGEKGSDPKELRMRFINRLLRSRNAAPGVASARATADRAAARRYWKTKVAADEAKRGERKGRP